MKVKQQIGKDLFRWVELPDVGPTSRPLRTVALSRKRLHPAAHQFNCSIQEWRGRLLLAYRTARAGSQLHVAELDQDTLQPIRTTKLRLSHDRAPGAQEDPRLFTFRGRLYLHFTGVETEHGQAYTCQLLARLDDSLKVEAVWYPDYGGRTWPMEKNWQFFEHSGELFTVYSMQPHVVLHVPEGPDGFTRAYPFRTVDTPLPWAWGAKRGGASPVLVGDEYWCFFHGAKDVAGQRVYSGGAYTFEARPPFAPKRITPQPILLPGEKTGDCWANVVFPCGAIPRGGKWLVSYGYQDAECRIAEYDHADIEKAMVPV